jgi:hypothetical protein
MAAYGGREGLKAWVGLEVEAVPVFTLVPE